jgi:hypothetical protein
MKASSGLRPALIFGIGQLWRLCALRLCLVFVFGFQAFRAPVKLRVTAFHGRPIFSLRSKLACCLLASLKAGFGPGFSLRSKLACCLLASSKLGKLQK